jgi:NitT/TauT family transport system ATP-binding protein
VSARVDPYRRTATGEVAGLAVNFDHVSHRFGEVPVLDDVTLSIQSGELVTVIGPSGCGKTTLLQMAAGLLLPKSGAVSVGGERVAGPDRRRRISYMFARDSLMPWRRAIDNLTLGLEIQGVTNPRPLGREMMARLGLQGFEGSYPSQLSHGMRQRVAIARTLITKPQLILMDEPFGALDAQTKILVEGEFLKLWEGLRATVVFVTHDLVEAVLIADRIVVMSARPARVKAMFEVKIPRPRDPVSTPSLAEFNDLRQALWEALRPELTDVPATS